MAFQTGFPGPDWPRGEIPSGDSEVVLILFLELQHRPLRVIPELLRFRKVKLFDHLVFVENVGRSNCDWTVNNRMIVAGLLRIKPGHVWFWPEDAPPHEIKRHLPSAFL